MGESLSVVIRCVRVPHGSCFVFVWSTQARKERRKVMFVGTNACMQSAIYMRIEVF